MDYTYVPDHFDYESQKVCDEMVEALDPLIEKVGPAIFTRALCYYYIAWFYHSVYGSDAKMFSRDIDQLVSFHRDNLMAVAELAKKLDSGEETIDD